MAPRQGLCSLECKMKTLIFFGATGNLFTQKIFPALSSLFYHYEIRDLALIALGRRFSKEGDYRRFLQKIHQREEKELLERVFYLPGDRKPVPITLFLLSGGFFEETSGSLPL